jgi:tetratricopeptide (TPR) repeat protein
MWHLKVITALALCLVGASTVLAQQEKWNELNQEMIKLNQQGKYAEAIKVAEKRLEIAERTFGPDHPNVATSLSNLAELYDSQGMYSEAEPLFKRALAIREQALGPDDPDVAASLANLAELYRAQGKYAEAEPLYKRALPIYVKALGADDPTVATVLSNLLKMKKQMGNRNEASECEECPQRIEPQKPDR